MYSKWYKYLLFLVTIISVANTNGSFRNAFAQSLYRQKERLIAIAQRFKSGSWGNGGGPQGSKNRYKPLKNVWTGVGCTGRKKFIIGKNWNTRWKIISTEEARKKLGLACPGSLPCIPLTRKIFNRVQGSPDDKYSLGIWAGCNSGTHLRIMMQIMDTEINNIDVRRARLSFVETSI